MSGRLHHVTHLPGAGRRYGHEARALREQGLSAHVIRVGLVNTVTARWERERFGLLSAPWVPSPPSATPCSPEARLAHLIELADQHLTEISRGAWRLCLDDDLRPRSVILTRAGAVAEVMRLTWQGRLLLLDTAQISLAAECAPPLLSCIASRCGSRLGWF